MRYSPTTQPTVERVCAATKDGNVYIDCVKHLDDFFGGWKCSEIDASAVRKFQHEQKEKGLSNGSINRAVSKLRRMFSMAHRKDRIRDVPYFPFLKESAPRSGFVERADYERLYTALPAYLKPVLALGFWTGMRRSEILNLEWDQVDFVASTIQLRAGTTKTMRPVRFLSLRPCVLCSSGNFSGAKQVALMSVTSVTALATLARFAVSARRGKHLRSFGPRVLEAYG